MADWTPQYLNFKVSNKSHQAIDADYWNALWNTVIAGVDNATTGVKHVFDNFVSGVKGGNEVEYRHGDVSITKDNIGLGNVDNTADNAKRVAYAADSGTTNGHTIESDVPPDAIFFTPEGVEWSEIIEHLDWMTNAEVDAIFEV